MCARVVSIAARRAAGEAARRPRSAARGLHAAQLASEQRQGLRAAPGPRRPSELSRRAASADRSRQAGTSETGSPLELRGFCARLRIEVVTLRIPMPHEAVARVLGGNGNWRPQLRPMEAIFDTTAVGRGGRSRAGCFIVIAAVRGHAFDHHTERPRHRCRRAEKPNDSQDQFRCPHNSSPRALRPARPKFAPARLTSLSVRLCRPHFT